MNKYSSDYLNCVLVLADKRSSFIASDKKIVEHFSKSLEVQNIEDKFLVSKGKIEKENKDEDEIKHKKSVKITAFLNNDETVNLVNLTFPRYFDISFYEKDAEEYKDELMNNKLTKDIVRDVRIDVKYCHFCDDYISLITENNLNEENIEDINDYLACYFGCDEYNQRDVMENFQVDNEIHKGIIISLLSICDFNTYDLFSPMTFQQNYYYTTERFLHYHNVIELLLKTKK